MEVDRHQGLGRIELEGTGDPLASIETTLETLALLGKRHPSLALSLTTLGIGGAQYAVDLAAAGLDSAHLLVDTIDPATAEKLYAWIRPGKKTVPLHKTVPLLLEEQPKTVRAMVAAGIAVTIRTTVYPGINADQVEAIAEGMALNGAKVMELVPFAPDHRQAEGLVAPTQMQMRQIAQRAGQYLTVSCRQSTDCNGTAVTACETGKAMQPGLPRPSVERPRVAVASSTGMDVDLHLGQAKTLLIYGARADGLTCLLETRQAPDPGSGETRWEQLADTLHDCFVLLAASAGQRPREVLAGRGIRVLITEENIEGTVDVLYGGGKKQKCKKE